MWSGAVVVSVVGVGVYAATSDRFDFKNVGAALLSLAVPSKAPPAPEPERAAGANQLAALPDAPAVPDAPGATAPSGPDLRLDSALDTVFPVSRDPDAAAQPPDSASPPRSAPERAATPPAKTTVQSMATADEAAKPAAAAKAPSAPDAPAASAKPKSAPAPVSASAKPDTASGQASQLAALTGATRPPPSFPLPPRRPRFAAAAAVAPTPAPAPTETAPRHAALSSALGREMAPPADLGGAVSRSAPGADGIPTAGLPASVSAPTPAPPPQPLWASAPVPRAATPLPTTSQWLATTEDAGRDRTATNQVAAMADCTDRDAPGCATAKRSYSWYAGAELSVAGNAVSKFTAPNVDLKAELEKAGTANVFAGYRASFGTRFEAELFHRRHGFDETTVNSDGGAGALLGVGSLSGVSGDGAGHLSMTGLMANVFQDFRLMDSVRPFVGAGIGVARVNIDNGGLPQAVLLDGDDDVLAYQLAGGIAFSLRDNLDLFVEYRYFATDDYDIRYATGSTARGSLETHNFGVGIRYGF